MRTFIPLILTVAAVLEAAPIQIADTRLFVHDSSGLVAELNSSSPSFFSTLDAFGEGTFGWLFTNNSGQVLPNVRLLAVLDADLDRDGNTFFNEYGEFLSLALAAGSPSGAVAAIGWEIDEPGFLFGNIFTNAANGQFDETNTVTSALPDDVALGLSFSTGDLSPGQSLRLTLSISPQAVAGLRQVDADSFRELYFNGFAEVQDPPPVNAIPEPSLVVLTATGLGSLIALRGKFSCQ
jgi:hypothetical protein